MTQTETQELASPGRCFLGTAMNAIPFAVVSSLLAGWFMDLAEAVLAVSVGWPQSAFTSAYPDDARNGYLLWVLAVLVTVLLFSGLIGGVFGASPGKALIGIRYRRDDGTAAGFARMFLRALLIALLLIPVLLLGQMIGFIFGPSARTASVIVLIATAFVFRWLIAAPMHDPEALSWVNRTAGVRPVIRPRNVSN